MLWANILAIIGGGLMFLSDHTQVYELLIIGRFITGLHSGNWQKITRTNKKHLFFLKVRYISIFIS